MDAKPRPLAGILLLGAAVLALGVLLAVWTGARETAGAAADVSERILAPDGSLVFSTDRLRLDAADANVLGALLGAADEGNFTVDVTYMYGGQGFVRAIAGHANKGSCGWVWDLNDARGVRAADLQPLRSGDRILWHWSCEG